MLDNGVPVAGLTERALVEAADDFYVISGGKSYRVKASTMAAYFGGTGGSGTISGPAETAVGTIALWDSVNGTLLGSSALTAASFAAASHTQTLSTIIDAGTGGLTYKAALERLSGTDRLDASAIKNLPSTGTVTSGVRTVNGLDGDVSITTASISAADAIHGHSIADTTGLQASLDGKSATTHSHAPATASADGFFPAADKAKLNGIAPGATANATDAFLLALGNQTGVLPLAKLDPTGATAGQVVQFNGVDWTYGSSAGTMSGPDIAVELQGIPNPPAHIDAMGGVTVPGPFVAGDLVQRNAANTGWERVSPQAFTPAANSWQRYDAGGNPITVSDVEAIGIDEAAKVVLAITAPAPVSPATVSSIAIARLPYHRSVRLTAAGANMVLDQAISGIPDGDVVLIEVVQDATGGWTLAKNHALIETWGVDPFKISTAANSKSILVLTGQPGGLVRLHNTGFTS